MDDLVKLGRAVERDLNNGFPMTCERGGIIQQMADRIEALTAERDALEAEKSFLTGEMDVILTGRADEYDRAEAAEAKLAQAVGALYKIGWENCDYTTGEGHADAIQIARAFLATIQPEGETE